MSAVINCSFCGKNSDEVDYIVAAPPTHICDQCVQKCVETIAQQQPYPSYALKIIHAVTGIALENGQVLLNSVKSESLAAQPQSDAAQ